MPKALIYPAIAFVRMYVSLLRPSTLTYPEAFSSVEVPNPCRHVRGSSDEDVMEVFVVVIVAVVVVVVIEGSVVRGDGLAVLKGGLLKRECYFVWHVFFLIKLW